MAHTETMLESKEIFNGRVIRVTVDKVQLEDGTTSTREIVHHHGGACILPVDADGSVVVAAWRQEGDDFQLEVPTYRTARGTEVAARRWRLAKGRDGVWRTRRID